jgi:hypothetical protein
MNLLVVLALNSKKVMMKEQAPNNHPILVGLRSGWCLA